MKTSAQLKISILDMTYIALFAVVIAVCSWISIPALVPFTLQTFGVFVTVGALGGKRGSLAVLIYLLLGMVGIPVFAGFSGGIGHMLGATGGYIVGFLFSALAMWALEKIWGTRLPLLALSMVIGLLICYLFGTVWFVSVYTRNTGAIGFWSALTMCVVPYIIPDLLKIALALTVCKRLAKVLKLS